MSFDRALLYSQDRAGKRFRSVSSEYNGCRPKPTKPHALSHPDDGGREEDLMRDAERIRAEAKLTELERKVLRLKREVQREVRRECVTGEEFAAALDAGWLQVSGYTVSKDVMDPGMTYDEIANVLGLSVWQVHRQVKSAWRKLRGVR